MASAFDGTKKSRLLRKAAYWLEDYARAFRNVTEPGCEKFHKKLRKLAADCRKESRTHD